MAENNNMYQNTLNLVKRVPETEVKPIDNFVSESDILAQGALDSYTNHEPDFKLHFKDFPSTEGSFSGFGFGFGVQGGLNDFQNGIINGKKFSNVNRQEDIRENLDINKYYTDMGYVGGDNFWKMVGTGALTGAAIGVKFGGVGAGVGAVIGGIVGGFQGASLNSHADHQYKRNTVGRDEDYLARQQGWGGRMVNGINNLIVAAEDSTLGLLGVMTNLPNAFSDFDSLWKNQFSEYGNRLQELNGIMSQTYHTNSYKNASMVGKFFHSEGFAEMVMPGIGFMLPGMGIGRATNAGLRAVGLMRGLGRSSLAVGNAMRQSGLVGLQALESGGVEAAKRAVMGAMSSKLKKVAIKEGAKAIVGNGLTLITSALPEAAIESYSIYHNSKKAYEDNFLAVYGRMPTAEERANFERDATKVSNLAFGLNVAVVGSSNFVVMGDIMGVGRLMKGGSGGALTRLLGMNIEKSVEKLGSGLTRSVYSSSISGKKLAAYTVAKALEKPLTEGVWEEGIQGVISSASSNYLDGRYDVHAGSITKGFWESVHEGFKHTYGTKEGFQEVLTGMVIGSLGSIRTHNGIDILDIRESLGKRAEIEGNVELLNKTSLDFTTQTENLIRAQSLYNAVVNPSVMNSYDTFSGSNQVVSNSRKSREALAQGQLNTAMINFQNAQFAKMVAEKKAGFTTYGKQRGLDMIDSLDDETLKNMSGHESIDDMQKFREQLKSDIEMNYKMFDVATSAANKAIRDDAAGQSHDPDLLREVGALHIFHGMHSFVNSKNILNTIEEMVGKEGIADALQYYSMLGTKQKELGKQVLEKRKEVDNATKERNALLNSYSREVDNVAKRQGENTDVNSKAKENLDKIRALDEKIQALELEKNELEKRAKNSSSLDEYFGYMEDGAPADNGLLSFLKGHIIDGHNGAISSVEALESLDTYLRDLSDSTGKSEEEAERDKNKALVLANMIDMYRTQMELSRNFVKMANMFTSREYARNGRFKKSIDAVDSLGRRIFQNKYRKTEEGKAAKESFRDRLYGRKKFDFEKWIELNKEFFDETTLEIIEKLKNDAKERGLSDSKLQQVLINSEIMRMGLKVKAGDYNKTAAGLQKYIDSILEGGKIQDDPNDNKKKTKTELLSREERLKQERDKQIRKVMENYDLSDAEKELLEDEFGVDKQEKNSGEQQEPTEGQEQESEQLEEVESEEEEEEPELFKKVSDEVETPEKEDEVQPEETENKEAEKVDKSQLSTSDKQAVTKYRAFSFIQKFFNSDRFTFGFTFGAGSAYEDFTINSGAPVSGWSLDGHLSKRNESYLDARVFDKGKADEFYGNYDFAFYYDKERGVLKYQEKYNRFERRSGAYLNIGFPVSEAELASLSKEELQQIQEIFRELANVAKEHLQNYERSQDIGYNEELGYKIRGRVSQLLEERFKKISEEAFNKYNEIIRKSSAKTESSEESKGNTETNEKETETKQETTKQETTKQEEDNKVEETKEKEKEDKTYKVGETEIRRDNDGNISISGEKVNGKTLIPTLASELQPGDKVYYKGKEETIKDIESKNGRVRAVTFESGIRVENRTETDLVLKKMSSPNYVTSTVSASDLNERDKVNHKGEIKEVYQVVRNKKGNPTKVIFSDGSSVKVGKYSKFERVDNFDSAREDLLESEKDGENVRKAFFEAVRQEIARIEANYQEAINPTTEETKRVIKRLDDLNTAIADMINSIDFLTEDEKNDLIKAINSIEASEDIRDIIKKYGKDNYDGIIEVFQALGMADGLENTENGVRLYDLLRERALLEENLLKDSKFTNPLNEEQMKMTFDTGLENDNTDVLPESSNSSKESQSSVLNTYEYGTFKPMLDGTNVVSNITPATFISEVSDTNTPVTVKDKDGNIKQLDIDNPNHDFNGGLEEGDIISFSIGGESVSVVVDGSNRLVIDNTVVEKINKNTNVRFSKDNKIGSSNYYTITKKVGDEFVYFPSDYDSSVNDQAAQEVKNGDPITFVVDMEHPFNKKLVDDLNKSVPDRNNPVYKLEEMLLDLLAKRDSAKKAKDIKSVTNYQRQLTDLTGLDKINKRNLKSYAKSKVKEYEAQFDPKAKEEAIRKFKDNMVIHAEDFKGRNIGVLKGYKNGNNKAKLDALRTQVLADVLEQGTSKSVRSKVKLDAQFSFVGIPNITLDENGKKVVYNFSDKPSHGEVSLNSVKSVGYVTYGKGAVLRDDTEIDVNYADKVRKDPSFDGKKVPIVVLNVGGKNVAYPIGVREDNSVNLSEELETLLGLIEGEPLVTKIEEVNSLLAEHGVSKDLRVSSLDYEGSLNEVLGALQDTKKGAHIDSLMKDDFREELKNGATIDVDIDGRAFIGSKVRFNLNNVGEVDKSVKKYLNPVESPKKKNKKVEKEIKEKKEDDSCSLFD